jgi:hypothetical protein
MVLGNGGVRKDHYRNGAQKKMAPKWLQKVQK